MATTYEWAFETTDAHGDIDDTDHVDRLSVVLPADVADVHPGRRLVLVKTWNGVWMSDSGRAWAYPTTTTLTQFDDGTAVPQKYQREFRRALLAGAQTPDRRNTL